MIHYENLDELTRKFMLRELEIDLANDALYVSPRLTHQGRRDYPSLLRQAIIRHDDLWLARELRALNLIKTYEQRKKPTGGHVKARVAHTAADTLAEGEFNRFFIRGLCARALEQGIDEVEVYRGKPVTIPRARSETLIGSNRKAKKLLEDLRAHPGLEPSLGVPPGPNSGLTVRMPGAKTQTAPH